MIQVENISKQYQNITAVSKVSFEVSEGETLVLLGTSGCGKTTMLRLLNRLAEPDSGTIKINGRDISRQPAEELRKGIGYVLQHHGLFPHYTIGANIAIVPSLLGWSKPDISARVGVLMEKLGLPAVLLSSYPHELSGGQQQRVGLARALAADPPILLMDEPFGALDPLTRLVIRNEFKTLDELKRKTVVLVTHDVQEAFELGGRICLMDKGAIVQIGKPAELLFNPANSYARQFFARERLQLELTTIKIKDVWSLLPSFLGKAETTIFSNHSLWHAMEKINSGKPVIHAKDAVSGELKTVDFGIIQHALNSYNQNTTHA
jgi:osmoprotectant transport system ATP-binding protein